MERPMTDYALAYDPAAATSFDAARIQQVWPAFNAATTAN
jgi:hypothetical protein